MSKSFKIFHYEKIVHVTTISKYLGSRTMTFCNEIVLC